jgi:hypothetical protein
VGVVSFQNRSDRQQKDDPQAKKSHHRLGARVSFSGLEGKIGEKLREGQHQNQVKPKGDDIEQY